LHHTAPEFARTLQGNPKMSKSFAQYPIRNDAMSKKNQQEALSQ